MVILQILEEKPMETGLNEIARFLKQTPGLTLRVVGHTDAIGSMKHNMDLSKRRAEAVAKFLTSEKGISADRLTPCGVGPLAPVASNKEEKRLRLFCGAIGENADQTMTWEVSV